MKTASELADACLRIYRSMERGDAKTCAKELNAIQLDAMREGMRRAATEANKMQESQHTAGGWINKAILTAAEQLTEEDLT